MITMQEFSGAETARALALAMQGTSVVDEPRRSRLRFTGLHFERTPSARCTAIVELEWTPGDVIRGQADGIASPLGDLRVVADATLRAIESFTKGTVTLELIGVKTMRAFDANVVMVSVLARGTDGERRLLGCHLSDDNLSRSTVIATLQATNRALGNTIATR
ncbi:MAG: hypothetical protein IPK85_14790 [Gemmatimonadetes bacterium]|nr:hypothetical protein [Gemmatimonadota bacterium]